MNSTLSNNFVMEKDADVGEDVANRILPKKSSSLIIIVLYLQGVL